MCIPVDRASGEDIRTAAARKAPENHTGRGRVGPLSIKERSMRIPTLLLAMLLPVTLAAEPEPWMRSETPGELSIAAGAESDCPVTPEDVKVHMESVLEREGIEAVPFSGKPSALFLAGSVECEKHGDGVWVFRAAVEFDSLDRELSDWIGSETYVQLGIGGRGAIIKALMADMEEAIEDYKASNRDYDF